MICPQCGSVAPDDRKFCGNCGVALAADEPETPEVEAFEPTTDLDEAVAKAKAVIEESAYRPDETATATPPEPDPFPAPEPESGIPDAGVGVAAGIGAAAGAAFTPPSYGSPSSYDQQPTPPQGAYQQPAQQPYQQPYQQPEYVQQFYQQQEQQGRRQQGYAQQRVQRDFGGQAPGNRALAMCLYTGLLALIFGFVARDNNDAFITHHLNQALVILIGSVLAAFLSVLIIGFLLAIFLLVMTIMGMVSAYNGEMKELPLIGMIKIVK